MLHLFPNTTYQINDYSYFIKIKNFNHKITIIDDYINKNNIKFQTYTIKSTDTPEEVSRLFYHSDKYWFIILLINKIENPFFDWIMTNEELILFAEKFVTENPLRVQQYISQHPTVLQNMSEQFNINITTYNPNNPTDTSEDIVNYMISYYYDKLLNINNKKQDIMIPDFNTINIIYNLMIKNINEFK